MSTGGHYCCWLIISQLYEKILKAIRLIKVIKITILYKQISYKLRYTLNYIPSNISFYKSFLFAILFNNITTPLPAIPLRESQVLYVPTFVIVKNN